MVFDGNLCHEVEAFNGERYSAVLFTAKNYKRATDTQIQADLAAMGCNWPTTDTLRRLTSLLPMPDAAGQRKRAFNKLFHNCKRYKPSTANNSQLYMNTSAMTTNIDNNGATAPRRTSDSSRNPCTSPTPSTPQELDHNGPDTPLVQDSDSESDLPPPY